MLPTFDAALLREWARAATVALERHCAEIDRINVFPVPDGDTGTNLLLTMRSAGDAVRRGLREGEDGSIAGAGPVASALARGALVGARGNSGVILSQVLRGIAEAVSQPAAQPPGLAGGAVLADALTRADRLARAAVAQPREGTVLTVLAAAAEAAGEAASDRLDVVATAAAAAAEVAVRATTGQLAELARAGVVDAGGLGLYVVLDALAGLCCGRPPATVVPLAGADASPRAVRGREALVAERETGSPDFDYEVMYLLDGADTARVDGLRGRARHDRGLGGRRRRRGARRHRDLERPRALHRHRRGVGGRCRRGPSAPRHGDPIRRPDRRRRSDP